MALSTELISILVCPKCKGKLIINDAKDGLICNSCSVQYEIRDDIPIMLVDAAQPISSSKK